MRDELFVNYGFCLQRLFHSTDADKSSRLFGKRLLFNLEQILAVSNQNMYTPNLHIGIIDDTTSG